MFSEHAFATHGIPYALTLSQATGGRPVRENHQTQTLSTFGNRFSSVIGPRRPQIRKIAVEAPFFGGCSNLRSWWNAGFLMENYG